MDIGIILACIHEQNSHFKSIYGILSPKLLEYTTGKTKIQAVDETLKTLEEIISILRANLQMAKEDEEIL